MSEVVLIYGRSDDLIEIDGAIRDEIYGGLNETEISFDNGDSFVVQYTEDGEWDIEQEGNLSSHMTKVEILETGSIPSLCEYSQIAVYQPWNGVSEVEKQ